MNKPYTIRKIKLRFSSPLQPLREVNKIIYHHMSRTDWTIYDVHRFHKRKGWKGIGYNYWIGYNGTIFEARGEHVGAHVRGWNNQSLGIGFQGDYDEQQQMPKQQLQAGVWLTVQLMKKYGLSESDLLGHKDISGGTTCPGDYFPMAELKEQAAKLMTARKR